MCLWWVNEEIDFVLVCKREKSWIQEKVYSYMFLIIEEKRSKSISFLEFLSWQAKTCHWRKETGGGWHEIFIHSLLLMDIIVSLSWWNNVKPAGIYSHFRAAGRANNNSPQFHISAHTHPHMYSTYAYSLCFSNIRQKPLHKMCLVSEAAWTLNSAVGVDRVCVCVDADQ